jgi:hypothetical protein
VTSTRCDGLLGDLTIGKNSFPKRALRSFFSLRGTVGAAAAAARVVNPD